LGVGTGGVEFDAGFFRWADAGGIFGGTEIVDEFGADEKDARVILVCGFAVVGYGGVIGLGEDFGEGPGFAGVGGEGEVGAVLLGVFVVAAGDYAVGWVAESDGEDSGGIGAVNERSVEDFPGLTAVGGVEDAGDAAAGGEPDVGVGG